MNLEDASKLVRVDLRAGKVVATWDLGPCETPTGLALDTSSRRVFSVCENRWMVVTDADNGRQVARLPIGSGADAVVYDPATRLALVSSGDGTLSVITTQCRHIRGHAHHDDSWDRADACPRQRDAQGLPAVRAIRRQGTAGTGLRRAGGLTALRGMWEPLQRR